MSKIEAYQRAVAARRGFSLPGYTTLATAGFDGDLVCPIHATSGNLTGPMLISKDWLDAPSAALHQARLKQLGYLPEIPFNRVIDAALARLGLHRSHIYITPVFKLLPARRSSVIPAADARASWQAVTRHELLGRVPVALGSDAQGVLRHYGVPHVPAPHPSARGETFATRAKRIADAVHAACQMQRGEAGLKVAGNRPAIFQGDTHVI